MYLNFHGFSFDLFGLSRRTNTQASSERPSHPQGVLASDRLVRQPEEDKNDPPEISFRGLSIFPIL